MVPVFGYLAGHLGALSVGRWCLDHQDSMRVYSSTTPKSHGLLVKGRWRTQERMRATFTETIGDMATPPELNRAMAHTLRGSCMSASSVPLAATLLEYTSPPAAPRPMVGSAISVTVMPSGCAPLVTISLAWPAYRDMSLMFVPPAATLAPVDASMCAPGDMFALVNPGGVCDVNCRQSSSPYTRELSVNDMTYVMEFAGSELITEMLSVSPLVLPVPAYC